MACAESTRLQAYFDAEVDALTAAAIERHLEGCCECRHQLEGLESGRASLRRHLPLERAGTALRARIAEALDHETGQESRQETRQETRKETREAAPAALSAPASAPAPGRAKARTPGRAAWPRGSFWGGVLAGSGVTALAAAAAVLLLLPGRPDTADALEAAHARSLMPAHLLDVESSERHTVKPWFAGHADVSPVVGDFPQGGYNLLGGRADYLWGQRSAVLVYRHGAHVINVFSWPAAARALPSPSSRAGYHMVCWRSGDLAYCAVSDAGWEELHGLARLIQDLASRDAARE